MRLHDKQFYSEGFNKDDYVSAQIDRHKKKYKKKRKADHYFECTDRIMRLISNNSSMICLGTRNNHERDMFKKGLKPKNVDVCSLDISPLSHADYVMDFNSFPEEWNDKWDIVFSNALDHAVDATITFYKWLQITKPNGIIILGFDKNEVEEVEVREPVGKSDCCSFNSETVDSFMKVGGDQFEFIDYFENSYRYYVLRKK